MRRLLPVLALLAGCAVQVDAKHPVAPEAAREAEARFVAGDAKVPVRDELGHTHEAQWNDLHYGWDDGRSLPIMRCDREMKDVSEGHSQATDCTRPPPPVRAEVAFQKKAPNWEAIFWGSLGVVALGASAGCIASWCNETQRTGVIAADAVVLGGLAIGAGIFVLYAVKAGTRD